MAINENQVSEWLTLMVLWHREAIYSATIIIGETCILKIYFMSWSPAIYSQLVSQHWFRYWLGAVRQQAITWTYVDHVKHHHMVSLSLNKFKRHRWKNAPFIWKWIWRAQCKIWWWRRLTFMILSFPTVRRTLRVTSTSMKTAECLESWNVAIGVRLKNEEFRCWPWCFWKGFLEVVRR